MAIDKRVDTVAESMQDVADGATVMLSGFGGAGFPNVLIGGLVAQGARDLTLVVNSATHRLSLTHELIAARRVRKIICSAARGHAPGLSVFEEQWREGHIELECVPQGTFAERIRAGGAGIPAFFSPVGVGTELTQGKEVRDFDGVEHVLETAIKGDVALIRGDTGDRFGNVQFRYAQANFSPAMATAADTTIAEVRRSQAEAIHPESVQLSGVYVDRVVTVSDANE